MRQHDNQHKVKTGGEFTLSHFMKYLKYINVQPKPSSYPCCTQVNYCRNGNRQPEKKTCHLTGSNVTCSWHDRVYERSQDRRIHVAGITEQMTNHRITGYMKLG